MEPEQQEGVLGSEEYPLDASMEVLAT